MFNLIQRRKSRFEEFRGIGSRVMRDSRGNPEVARALAGEYLEDAGYGSVWVIIGIRVIMFLIEWWLSSAITDPGDTPVAGEPGSDDFDWDGLGLDDSEWESP